VGQLEQALRDFGLSDLHSGGVEKARAFLAALAPPAETLPPIHRVESRAIPGPGGEIPVRIYHPSDQDHLPVLMWFHGGGWVLGTLDFAEATCRMLANRVGCAVVSVDYRLAPETPFPGAVEDCLAATRWVASSAAELGIDAGRIAVGGDSAGGNLAACVAYCAREIGQELALQLLVYPVIDADFDRPSYIDNAEGYLLTRNAMQWYWDRYVPDHAQRRDPRVSPIHASKLSGLAPAFILTAEFDPLRDEAEAYGEALAAAGVAATTKRYEGVIHGFFGIPTEGPVEEVALAANDAVEVLQRVFGGR
jgi:acetyl esterase